MHRIAALLAVFAAMLMAGPAHARDGWANGALAGGNVRTVVTESWVEEWDPASGQWVRVPDEVAAAIPADAPLPVVTTTFVNGTKVTESRSAARYAVPAVPRVRSGMLGQYGPFVVTSPTSAAMIGSTDSATPYQFDAMLRDFPQLAMIEMIEAPGTSNDIANLAVGRRIRAAGISTHVPQGGSVRSGAVELFLAGATRTVDDGASFAVHSWLDNYGREADDFAADHPAHRLYIDYYVEMGMSEARAREFYAMTNSVPHHTALWLASDDMRQWLGPEQAFASRSIALKGPRGLKALAGFAMTAAARQGAQQADAVPMIGYVDLEADHGTDSGAATLAQLGLSLLDSGVALP